MAEPCSKEAEIATIHTQTETLIKQVDEIHRAVIGVNGEGIRGKVKSALVQLKFQWAILGALFIWLVVKNLVL
jgi:uncharacterized protein (DUF2236 family)